MPFSWLLKEHKVDEEHRAQQERLRFCRAALRELQVERVGVRKHLAHEAPFLLREHAHFLFALHDREGNLAAGAGDSRARSLASSNGVEELEGVGPLSASSGNGTELPPT